MLALFPLLSSCPQAGEQKPTASERAVRAVEEPAQQIVHAVAAQHPSGEAWLGAREKTAILFDDDSEANDARETTVAAATSSLLSLEKTRTLFRDVRPLPSTDVPKKIVSGSPPVNKKKRRSKRAKRQKVFPPNANAPSKNLLLAVEMPENHDPLTVTFKPPYPNFVLRFSEPVVSNADLDKKTIPQGVRLTPLPDGDWRWTDLDTLQFFPKDKLALATKFELSISGDLKSQNGKFLNEAKAFSFSTPTNGAQFKTRGADNGLQPNIWILFSHPTDVDTALALVSAKVAGKTYPLRAATEKERLESAWYREMEAWGKPDEQRKKWTALRPLRNFPRDSKVTVEVKKGISSPFGPLVSSTPRSHSFRTYPPFRVKQAYCRSEYYESEYDREPTSNGGCWIFFTTSLARDTTNSTPGASITPARSWLQPKRGMQLIYALGAPKPGETFTAVVDKNLTDKYGQVLVGETKFVMPIRKEPRRPELLPGPGMVVQPADSPKVYSVVTVAMAELRVRVANIDALSTKELYDDLRRFDRDIAMEDIAPLFDKTYSLEEQSEETTTQVDLSSAIPNQYGQALILVDATDDKGRKTSHAMWIQRTDLAVRVHTAQNNFRVWVTSLSKGTSLPGVDVTGAKDLKSTTDARGVARFTRERVGRLEVRRGRDRLVLPYEMWRDGDVSEYRGKDRDKARFYLVDDRAVYRPGERVTIKGWVRDLVAAGGATDLTFPPEGAKFRYRVTDASRVSLASGETKLSPAGGFDVSFLIPKSATLGAATLSGSVSRRGSVIHSFRIAEFRRPEFKVDIVADGPQFEGNVVVSGRARLFDSTPLSHVNLSWKATANRHQLVLPGYKGWTFRSQIHISARRGWSSVVGDGARQQMRADASGSSHVRIRFEPPLESPIKVNLVTSMSDVNNERNAARKEVIVFPAGPLIGLKTKPRVMTVDKVEVEVATVDVDGKALTGEQIEVWATLIGSGNSETGPSQVCRFRSTAIPARCVFASQKEGTFFVQAKATRLMNRSDDDRARNAPQAGGMTSETTVFVTDTKPTPRRLQPWERVPQLALTPSKKEASVGDVVSLNLESQFVPTEGWLVIERYGEVRDVRFSMASKKKTLHIPIEDRDVPGVEVSVFLIGRSEGKPVSAWNRIKLVVDAKTRRLSVRVSPRKKVVAPGEQTTVDLLVADAAGRPVADAEVALFVVDEAALEPAKVTFGDPLTDIYRPRPAIALGATSRDSIVTDTAGPGFRWRYSRMERISAKSAPTSRSLHKRSKSSRLAARRDFRALAAFHATLVTDDNGKVSATVRLPDSVSEFRVVAIAAAGTAQFGKGLSSIRVQKDLVVRATPPRFLSVGDEARINVRINNPGKSTKTVDVGLRQTGALLSAGRRVQVPAKGRVEVNFPLGASLPQQSRIQIVARVAGRGESTSGVNHGNYDAVEYAFPVHHASTAEHFATYGTLDDKRVLQPIRPPRNAVREGGLTVSTSSSALSGLDDAFLYTYWYPHQSPPHLAAAVMAMASIDARDEHLTSTNAGTKSKSWPSSAARQLRIKKALARFAKDQNRDGGFSWWWRGEGRANASVPIATLQVAHAIALLPSKTIPYQLRRGLIRYLELIKRHSQVHPETKRASPAQLLDLRANAAFVLTLFGDRKGKRSVDKILAKADLNTFGTEAIAHLLHALALSGAKDSAAAASLAKLLMSRATQTASMAYFPPVVRTTGWPLRSRRQTDAIVLHALLSFQPERAILPKIARGLLAARKKGRWKNTHENAHVISALHAYLSANESVKLDCVFHAWLDDEVVVKTSRITPSTAPQHVDLGLDWANDETRTNAMLLLEKKGRGRLYYRVGLDVVPLQPPTEPKNNGFFVHRRYEAVSSDDDVSIDTHGNWHIKAGATVGVTIRFRSTSRRHHVALVDKLPAGLEPLSLTDRSTNAKERSWTSRSHASANDAFRSRKWFGYQQLHDEGAHAFSSTLHRGEYVYRYLARAITPGKFTAPAAKVEEMYNPETFGHSGATTVFIEYSGSLNP